MGDAKKKAADLRLNQVGQDKVSGRMILPINKHAMDSETVLKNTYASL